MKKRKTKSKSEQKKTIKKEPAQEVERGDFDFGGFPKDHDLKKNIGCGG
jgi:hypothetical protein